MNGKKIKGQTSFCKDNANFLFKTLISASCIQTFKNMKKNNANNKNENNSLIATDIVRKTK